MLLPSFANKAQEATVGTLIISVLCALTLLLTPVMFTLVKQHPYELCGRFYSFVIESDAFEVVGGGDVDGGGADGKDDDERSGDVLVYRFEDTVLAAPLEHFPASDFDNGDYNEIFDRLALLNNYYRDMLLPVILYLSVMCTVMLISLSGLLAGLLGLGRKMTHSLSFGKKLRVFAVCAWLPAIPSALLGFFLPVFHLFIYQIALGYFAWQTQKLL